MADLTAAEVQALAALAGNRPMTVEELARSLADSGMNLANEVSAESVNLNEAPSGGSY